MNAGFPTPRIFMLLAFTDNDKWVPGIGDPTVVGWVTVAAYFLAAVLCWRCVHRHRIAEGGWSGPSLFWGAFTLVLLFLGINKQLDLQTWFTLFGKHLAEREGWYDQRRGVQAAFIGAVALGGAVSLIGIKRVAGKVRRPVSVALMGGVLLGCFILIRASSFHHVDHMIGLDFEGIKVNWILELGSILFIMVGAKLELRALRLGARQV